MAITVNTVPATLSPAHNQQIYVITSNNTAQPNFNFLVDIYMGSTLISRLSYPKQPSSTQLKFDVMPVLRNYVTYDIENLLANLQVFPFYPNMNSEKDYHIWFGEVYDVSGISTVASGLTRSPGSGNRKVLNWIFDFEEATPAINLANYDIGTTNRVLYVTPQLHAANTPKYTIQEGQSLFCSILDKDSTDIAEISVDSNGVGNDIGVAGTTNRMHYNISIGYDLLKLVVTQTDIDTITANGFYNVFIRDGGGDTLAAVRVEIDKCKTKFETVRLHWLNNIGGWESFNFTMNNQHVLDIDRKNFKKVQSLGYNKYDRLTTQYNTTIQDTFTINSDWLNDDMLLYMQTLAISPVVLWEKPNGNIIAVTLSNQQYEQQKYLNGRTMHNVSFDVEPSYNRYRQTL